MEYGHVPYDYAHMFQEDVPNSIKWPQNDQLLEYFHVIGTVRTSQSCRFQICICCLNRKSNTRDIKENIDNYAHISKVSNSLKWLQNFQFLQCFNFIGTVRTSQSSRFQICICCLNRKSNTGDIRENTDDQAHIDLSKMFLIP